MSCTSHSHPYLFSDELASIPARELRFSKRDADRKFVEALGANIVTYSVMASLTILSIFAVLGVGAVVALERAEAAQARI